MDVSFKLMKRSGDRLFLLSEISRYDAQLPVVLEVTTEQGARIPAETFPYADLNDPVALESILDNAEAVSRNEEQRLSHSSTTAGVRLFVVVLPWFKIRRWELEFKAVDFDGTVVDSCKNRLDQEVVKWQARLNSATNANDVEAIEALDGRFVHDRIQVDFQRIIELHGNNLVTAQVEMPYHPGSELEFNFFNAKGERMELDYNIIEDSISQAVDSGASERRYLLITFALNPEDSHVCLCVSDNAGNIARGFAMLGPNTLEEITEEQEFRTLNAYNDPTYDEWFKEQHQADLPTLLEQVSQQFEYEPLISVVCLLRDTPMHHLYDLLASFRLQSYNKWELILVSLAETDNTANDILASFEEDERIYLLNVESGLSAPEKANAGLQAAEGEFVGFVSAEDRLAPDALFEFVRKFNEHPDGEIVYCDSDTVDAQGMHSKPVFLPSYSPELLRSYNYLRSFVLLKASLVYEIGMFSSDRTVLAEYDFILRATEAANRICHVPRVLLHRRYVNRYDIFTLYTEERNEAGRKALVQHCKRCGINAEVLTTERPFQYRLRHFLGSEAPKISVVVVSQDNPAVLNQCVNTIFSKERYTNFEVVVVDAASTTAAAAQHFETLQNNYPNLQVLRWERGYSRARIANFVAANTTGEYLLFMDDETQMITSDALEVMLGYFQSSNVGVVGPHQLFRDGTIEHAGLVVGGRRVATPLARYMAPNWRGYQDRNVLPINVTAVSGDCMMVSRKVFELVGGFTEEFSVMYSDVDFCLKAAELGYYTVCTPYAEFSHFKSVTRVRTYSKAMRVKMKREAALLQYLWPRNFTEGDVFYNQNLDHESPYYALPYEE